MDLIPTSPQVDRELVDELKRGGLLSALVNLKSNRLWKYLRQPQLLLYDGWKLTPDCAIDRLSPRSYMLGDGHTMGQQLVLDRTNSLATLRTFVRVRVQEIKVDLSSGEILSNRAA